MTALNQPGILLDLPAASRYQLWNRSGDAPAVRAALARLQQWADGEQAVVCIGQPVADLLGTPVPGLRNFPAITGPQGPLALPPHALCLWLRGNARGDVLRLSREAAALLAPAFSREKVVDCFRHGWNGKDAVRDLTGYEDGTENPKDDDAVHAAIADGMGPGLDGGSYFAVQQWQHDMDAFARMSALQKDHMIGRRLSDNEELDDAPSRPTSSAPRRRASSPKPLSCAAICPGGRCNPMAATPWAPSLPVLAAALRPLRRRCAAWRARKMALPMACSRCPTR